MNGVLSSDRGSNPRSEKRRGGAKTKNSSFARKIRLSVGVLAIAATAVVVLGSRTFADYADGYRTEQALTLPDAVKVWRQDAWRQDDFLSQVRLGDLYSNNQSIGPGESSKNPSFGDPVEAYVWYYMALRPGHDYRADETPNSYDTLYTVRNNALNNAEEIYYSLTFEQRLDARARILYILSSRGAEGYITLGRIHASSYYNGDNSLRKPYVILCMRSDWDHWYSSWAWWLWSLVSGSPYPHPAVWKWVSNEDYNWQRRFPDYQCDGTEQPKEPENNYPTSNTYSGSSTSSGMLSVAPGSNQGSGNPFGSPSVSMSADSRAPASNGASSNSPGNSTLMVGGGGSTMSGYGSGSAGSSRYYGSTSYSGGGTRQAPSVFISSDSEALTYFQIAVAMGHPLANAYASAERSTIKYNDPDAARTISDAEKRARFWTPPFEFYPGATSGGMPHSDESLPSLEQRMALSRIRELPPRAILEALDFRGYTRPAKLCGLPPVCFKKGVVQFQAAMGWEPNGFLTAPQTVRLIQMAAVDGDAIAQDRLGIMYAKGIGVQQNFVRAEKWFVKSANQRFPDALFNLYVLYKVGPNGIEPDEHKAVSYSAQAMAAGYNRNFCELQDLLRQADDAEHDHPDGARR